MKNNLLTALAITIAFCGQAKAWEILPTVDGVHAFKHDEDGAIITQVFVDGKAVDEPSVKSGNVAILARCVTPSGSSKLSISGLSVRFPLDVTFMDFAVENGQNISVTFGSGDLTPSRMKADLTDTKDGKMTFDITNFKEMKEEDQNTYVRSYINIFNILRKADEPIVVSLNAQEKGFGLWENRTPPRSYVNVSTFLLPKGSTAASKELTDNCGELLLPFG